MEKSFKLNSFVREYLPLFLILSLGVFLRFWRLNQIPPGFHGDEANTGLDALRILQEGIIEPYTTSSAGQPTGPLYWVVLILKIFGPSIWSVRIAIAILGCLSLLSVYGLTRLLFNHKTALFTTFFLTVSYWHLHFSRIGFMLISYVLLSTLSLLLLLQGIKQNSLFLIVAGGITAGLTFHTYNTAPVFLIASSLFLLCCLGLTKTAVVAKLKIVASFLIPAFLVSLPLTLLALRQPQIYFGHHQRDALFNSLAFKNANTLAARGEILIQRTIHVFSVLFKPGGVDGIDGLGTQPLLDYISQFFLILGLILLLKSRSRFKLPILAAIFLNFLPAMLSVGLTGDYRRSFGAVPFVAILVAHGLLGVEGWVKSIFSVKVHAQFLSYVLFGLVAFLNLSFYFGRFPHLPSTKGVFAVSFVKMSYFLKQYWHGEIVYFYFGGAPFDHEIRRFLAPNIKGVDRSREYGHFTLAQNGENPVIYLLMTPYLDLAPNLIDTFPNGTLLKLQDGDQTIAILFNPQVQE